MHFATSSTFQQRMVKRYYQMLPTSSRAPSSAKKDQSLTWRKRLSETEGQLNVQQFGYQHFLQNVVTVCTVTPAIPHVVANVAAGIIAAPGVPILVTYTNEIKIMEVYSDKLLEISQKHETFTTQTPQVIRGLVLVDSLLLDRR